MRWLLLILCLFPAGCANLIVRAQSTLASLSPVQVSTTKTPLTVDFNNTPVVRERASRGRLPNVSWQVVRLSWGGNGPGEVARGAGMDRMFYADVDRFIVKILWLPSVSDSVIELYGERDGAAAAAAAGAE